MRVTGEEQANESETAQLARRAERGEWRRWTHGYLEAT